jgi:hypothetical protein
MLAAPRGVEGEGVPALIAPRPMGCSKKAPAAPQVKHGTSQAVESPRRRGLNGGWGQQALDEVRRAARL